MYTSEYNYDNGTTSVTVCAQIVLSEYVRDAKFYVKNYPKLYRTCIYVLHTRVYV